MQLGRRDVNAMKPDALALYLDPIPVDHARRAGDVRDGQGFSQIAFSAEDFGQRVFRHGFRRLAVAALRHAGAWITYLAHAK